MKRPEAEQGIRYLCGVWAKLKGFQQSPDEDPSFGEFYSWLEANHFSYLQFKSSIGVRHDVYQWFNSEFRQNWRE